MKNIPVLTFFKITLAFLFLSIFTYNFFVAFNMRYETEGDAASFIGLGVSLAEFQKYGHINFPAGDNLITAFEKNHLSHKEITFGGNSTWRPPVWPLLIAGIFLIFGYNLTFVLIFKFLLHLLGIYIFYKTLKLLKLQEAVILIGTFLYGISPAWQLYSRVFLSEPITLFFITLWLYLLLRYIQEKSGIIPQALVGGVLILSHPYYIFLPFSVWLILWLTKIVRVKDFLISSAICASIVSIWVVRNFVVLETNEIVLTTSSGAVMAKGWNYLVPELHTNTKGDLADEELVLEDYEYNRSQGFNEVERMALYKNATLNFIKSNPDLIIPIISTKLFSAFNPFPETSKPGALETGRWLFQLLAFIALFYILLITNNKFLRSLVIGLITATIGITALTYSGFRFRMPQVGLELLFIIYVLNDITIRIKKKDWNFKNKSYI